MALTIANSCPDALTWNQSIPVPSTCCHEETSGPRGASAAARPGAVIAMAAAIAIGVSLPNVLTIRRSTISRD